MTYLGWSPRRCNKDLFTFLLLHPLHVCMYMYMDMYCTCTVSYVRTGCCLVGVAYYTSVFCKLNHSSLDSPKQCPISRYKLCHYSKGLLQYEMVMTHTVCTCTCIYDTCMYAHVHMYVCMYVCMYVRILGYLNSFVPPDTLRH